MPDTVPIQATVPVHVEGSVEVEGKIPAAEAAKEQALKTEGQRKINLVWEITQAVIAIMITAAVIYIATTTGKLEIIGNAFTLIIALYYVRTNHTKTGGISSIESR